MSSCFRCVHNFIKLFIILSTNIFFLRLHSRNLKQHRRRVLGLFSTDTWLDRIKRSYTQDDKDNNLIYHDMIPDESNLTAIGRAALAKPLQLSKPASENFMDIFTKMVPMAVHNALVAYESRKAEIVNLEIGRMREGTQLINRFATFINHFVSFSKHYIPFIYGR